MNTNLENLIANQEPEIEIDWGAALKQNGEDAARRTEYMSQAATELEARQAERDRRAKEAWLAMSDEQRAAAEARMKADRWF